MIENAPGFGLGRFRRCFLYVWKKDIGLFPPARAVSHKSRKSQKYNLARAHIYKCKDTGATVFKNNKSGSKNWLEEKFSWSFALLRTCVLHKVHCFVVRCTRHCCQVGGTNHRFGVYGPRCWHEIKQFFWDFRRIGSYLTEKRGRGGIESDLSRMPPGQLYLVQKS